VEENGEGRSARKRRAIVETATALFLRNGYQGTSMDDVAARAAVSKQTVYKNFATKEGLFGDIVLGITGNVDEFVENLPRLLGDAEDLPTVLGEIARRHITTVMQPQVIRLRRLIIAEAGRFPELARAYHDRAPGRVMTALADGFERLADRGLLRVHDSRLAAEHFAFLILGAPLDRALFSAEDKPFTEAELEHFADAGARAFLAIYGDSHSGNPD
jgi:TetR/AcrR family transcriptional regulator, mexJK operon transcriptional repressor